MKNTIDGGVIDDDVGDNALEISKRVQDKSADRCTNESSANEAHDTFSSKNNLSDIDMLESERSFSDDGKSAHISSNECFGTNSSKSSKEDGKANDLEMENVSPEPERRSSRLRGKRPKLTEIITTSDEEEYGVDDMYGRKDKDRKRGKKSFLAKYMQKTHPKGKQKSSSNDSRRKDRVRESRSSKKHDDSAFKPPKEFTSGAFVVLKADYHSSATPPIWKIDGKALLQKYLHFEKDGEILYKNTSTYSGWTSNNKDQYYPAAVELKSQNRQETVVRFDREAVFVEESD